MVIGTRARKRSPPRIIRTASTINFSVQRFASQPLSADRHLRRRSSSRSRVDPVTSPRRPPPQLSRDRRVRGDDDDDGHNNVCTRCARHTNGVRERHGRRRHLRLNHYVSADQRFPNRVPTTGRSRTPRLHQPITRSKTENCPSFSRTFSLRSNVA